MNKCAGRISVIDPVDAAIQRVKQMLFRPFHLEKWLIVGFCAWLANFGQSGGPSFNVRRGFGSAEELKNQVIQNLPFILVIGAVAITAGTLICVALMWLSSRGRFMFLHCVAEDRAEVKIPWRRYRMQGNSLFLFRLAVGFVALFVMGLLTAAAVVFGIVWGRSEGPAGVIIVAAVTTPALILLAVTFALVGKFTKDFVVPIMALRNCTCTAAWQEFWGMLGANKGRFAVYILFQVVIALVIGFITGIIVLATCCCAACIMAIPYIGAVFLLPLSVFMRAYSLFYLAQYGTAYNAIAPAPQPEAPPQYDPAPRQYTPPSVPPIQGL